MPTAQVSATSKTQTLNHNQAHLTMFKTRPNIKRFWCELGGIFQVKDFPKESLELSFETEHNHFQKL